jgi:hypothetical protein
MGKVTPYDEINNFIETYTLHLLDACKEKITGIYLTGSLSYGDFNLMSSDIDITNILKAKFNKDELIEVRKIHETMQDSFPKWSRRFECTYTTIAMLSETLPPKEPRPWYNGNESRLYSAAPYGNEWIMNKYLLYEYSIPLFGPDFKIITNGVEMNEFQQACIRDIFEEWEPKLNENTYFDDDRHSVYFVLNLCRILYTLHTANAGTKPQSSDWTRQKFPEWNNIILCAQQWEYGKKFIHKKEINNFAQFVITEVEQTELYKIYMNENDNLFSVIT